jgi:hypothetical protein
MSLGIGFPSLINLTFCDPPGAASKIIAWKPIGVQAPHFQRVALDSLGIDLVRDGAWIAGSSYLRWGRVRHADEADAVM